MMDQNFWQGKRVFLTGHTGFKGTWLLWWLHTLGAEVTGYALAPGTSPSLFDITDAKRAAASVVGDICDFPVLRQEMEAANPDIVIHMAAQALVGDSYRAPLLTYQTNVLGTAHVLEAVRSCKNARAVLVITTDKCYENKEWCWGYRENEALGGYDPYSSSKACAELVTAAYRQSFLREKGLHVATARAGNVIGGGDWAKDRLVPDCMRAIENQEKIVIRSPQAVRPWQHVLEPLHGYLLLAQKLYEEGEPWAQAWNFGPDSASEICVGDLVEKICVKFGASYELQNQSQFHEAQFLKLDCGKAKGKLKWAPQLGVEEALAYIAAWYESYWRGEAMREVTVGQIQRYQNLFK